MLRVHVAALGLVTLCGGAGAQTPCVALAYLELKEMAPESITLEYCKASKNEALFNERAEIAQKLGEVSMTLWQGFGRQSSYERAMTLYADAKGDRELRDGCRAQKERIFRVGFGGGHLDPETVSRACEPIPPKEAN